jgi:branched-chain amino acid aminotransferase
MDGSLVAASAATVSLVERGVQSGVGVFETLAVRSGRPVDLPEHLARLARSAGALSIALPAAGALEEGVGAVAARVPSGHGWLKVVAFRGSSWAAFGGSSPPEEEGAPCRALVLPWRRDRRDPLAGIKSTSYAGFIRGLEFAEARGADEGLFTNDRGHLTEGCTSNLFAIRGRALFTPAVSDGILEGITRAKVLQAARGLGLSVHEGKLRLPRLLGADEAFVSSSTRGVRPLVAVDGRPIGTGGAGRWTEALATATAALRGIPREQPRPAGSERGGSR